jgi:hypothetical protein
LLKIFKESQVGAFWNRYCIEDEGLLCTIPEHPDLYPLEVLYRLIKNEHINIILGFTDVNPFYKKYLKYKSKYLKLKKNIV